MCSYGSLYDDGEDVQKSCPTWTYVIPFRLECECMRQRGRPGAQDLAWTNV